MNTEVRAGSTAGAMIQRGGFHIPTHVLTSDRCWPRGELQPKGIGHLDHLFLRGWEDGFRLLRAAKDDWDIKTTPARTNSVS